MFPISLISYYDEAFKKLSNYWDALYEKTILHENPYELNPSTLPWKISELREFEAWVDEFRALEYSAPFFFEYFVVTGKDLSPCALTEYRREVAVEFSYLFPDDPDVKAILPVLLTSYIWGRRGGSNYKTDTNTSSMADDGDNHLMRGTRFLINLLMEHDNKRHSQFKKSMRTSLQPPKKNTRLPRLRYSAMTETKLKKSLSPFKTSILFLFFAYKTKDLCNLTLSCSLFIELSKCGILGDANFPNYASLSDNRETAPKIEVDPLREEILEYIQWALNSRCRAVTETTKGTLCGYTALDRFLLSLIPEILDRENHERRLTEDYLRRNEWAYQNIYEPYWEFCLANGRPLPIYDDDDAPGDIDWAALDEWNRRKVRRRLPPHKRLG